MKKSLALLLIFAALSITVMVRLNAEVSAERDAITITESTIYGDKKAARGIDILSKTQGSREHITWETLISIDDDVTSETEFEYLPGGIGLNRTYTYDGIRIGSSSFCMGASGPDLLAERTGSYAIGWDEAMLLPIVRDIAAGVENGQTKSEKVNLRDYCDYYVLNGHFEIGRSYNAEAEDKLHDILNENFKIPIERDVMLDISVTKDNDGKVTNFESNFAEGEWDKDIFISSGGVVLDDGIYFFIGASSQYDGRPVSVMENAEIKTGYGVYRIPFREESKKNVVGTVTIFEPEKMDTVFELERDELTVYIEADRAKSRLFLVTLQDDCYYLTIIDVKTGCSLQKFALFDYEREHEFMYIEVYDDFSVAVNGDGKIIFIADRGDRYEVAVDSDMRLPVEMGYIQSEHYVYGFDGKRGAVATRQPWFSFSSHYESCGMSLWVFDDTGLLYTGDFVSSQDTNPVTDTYCTEQYYTKASLELIMK